MDIKTNTRCTHNFAQSCRGRVVFGAIFRPHAIAVEAEAQFIAVVGRVTLVEQVRFPRHQRQIDFVSLASVGHAARAAAHKELQPIEVQGTIYGDVQDAPV